MFLDLGYHTANEIDGNRETDAGGTGILCQHRGIDADQLPETVDQSAAGVAGVNRSIGLNKIFEG